MVVLCSLCLQNFHTFSRGSTPDNRRVTNRYFHYPGHHHPDFHANKDGHAHGHGGHGHGHLLEDLHHPYHHKTISGKLSGKFSRPTSADNLPTNGGGGNGDAALSPKSRAAERQRRRAERAATGGKVALLCSTLHTLICSVV
jgi:hypothetical protein